MHDSNVFERIAVVIIDTSRYGTAVTIDEVIPVIRFTWFDGHSDLVIDKDVLVSSIVLVAETVSREVLGLRLNHSVVARLNIAEHVCAVGFPSLSSKVKITPGMGLPLLSFTVPEIDPLLLSTKSLPLSYSLGSTVTRMELSAVLYEAGRK